MSMSPQDERILKERVDTLFGVRGKPEMAAMRKGEAKPLLAVAAQIATAAGTRLEDLTSSDVTSPPSQNDFNALRADVLALRKAIGAILSALE